MTEASNSVNAETIAKEIAGEAAHAIEAGRPLFLIVYYEHEAVKVAFQGKLRQALGILGVTPQTFDPAGRPEHGTGRLYDLLSAASESKCLSLITGLPRSDAGELDNSFLEYLNLHRDLIPKKNLRFVLFLHAADAETLISVAGDLWDFRHHTYWLEGRPEAEQLSVWDFPERASSIPRLSKEDVSAVNKHLENVHALIEQTAGAEEKAALFLDLCNWLDRRNLPSFAADAAFEGIDVLPRESASLRNVLELALANALQNDNQLAEALHHYQKALIMSREIGDRAGEGTTLNNISQIYRAWGRNDEALKTLEECLAIYREIGDRAGEGTTLNNISQVYDAWGRYDEALKALEESLAIRREIGDRAGEGVTLNNISAIYRVWGRYDEALKTLEESLAIRREIGDRAGEGATLNNISQIYHVWGRLDEALKTLEESLAIRREIGDRAGEGATLNNISQIYHAWGRYDEALKTLEVSLAISREIGGRAGEGNTLNNISLVHDAWGRHDEALKTLEESLAIRREIGDRFGEAVTCWNIAKEYQRRCDFLKAAEYARQTVAIDEETKHPDLEEDRAFLLKLEEALAAKGAESDFDGPEKG
jgi:tetratricopeptide (TPR) repeat protein